MAPVEGSSPALYRKGWPSTQGPRVLADQIEVDDLGDERALGRRQHEGEEDARDHGGQDDEGEGGPPQARGFLRCRSGRLRHRAR